MALPPKSSRLVDVDLEVLEDNPGKATYASLLRQCGRSRALWAGKQVHSHMIARGLDRDKVLGDILVQMYGKCRSLGDARDAFERLAYRDVYSWSIIIAAFAQNGDIDMALGLYERMQEEGVQPDMFVYSSVVGAYCAVGDLQRGQEIHRRIVDSGMTPDVVVHNSLVNLYAKCGRIDDARSLFDGMQVKSLASWNAMIAGYAHLDLGDEAFDLFRCIDLEGLGPDMLTFINLLGACSTPEFVDAGRNIHARVAALGLDSNLVLATALLDMYAKCGSIEGARSVFASMADNKNQVSWNAMIAARVEYGHPDEAMYLYHQMHLQGLKPNAFTSASVLGACVCVEQGMQIHSWAMSCGFEDDPVVRTALVNMYSKFGRLEEAAKVFADGQGFQNDPVAWNAMITAYTEAWLPSEALGLFDEMRERSIAQDAGTLIAAANACSVLGDLSAARAVHSAARRSGHDSIVLQNSIINMYARCGSLDEARACFDSMPRRSVVSWNVLMSGYVEQQQGEESLKLVRCMDWQGIHPNAFTFSCVATACSLLKDLRAGRAAHSRIVASGFDTDRVVVTALMDMYGRCGSVEAARRTFDDMRRRCSTRVDVVSWNAMMGLYSHHGQPREALELFGEMGLAGEAGNEVSLTLVLHACTHAGLVADAVEALARGVEAGIVPSREHYACVVDVLARAGKLEVAEEVMNNMPVEPGIGAWKCLLGACAVHGDAGRGSSAAQHVVEMQPTNAAPYVLLSNIAKAPKP
ncbi:pentatricopeptide repeat-containing protein At4g13650 [Selaginella moellendorffii]|uniref:pentatricopeptide repeat-containing protein At4g13650 n=1 Tax=Selaginella moellendorffii TaxID=88036 RepID=UPI000D1CD072|nr:pentatricopeptide repeat-containing protein At4g13650 [Selaginella moellendorffii]|eukprot:XP_024518320.1 pentatricopeptide repeat-containing protein At4g13650 [Selaginella moellendorffii]